MLQAEGEDYALRSPERLWALVNFKSGPAHDGPTEAVIRMNYTTVPRTWVPVNKWKRHLSVRTLPQELAYECATCVPVLGFELFKGTEYEAERVTQHFEHQLANCIRLHRCTTRST